MVFCAVLFRQAARHGFSVAERLSLLAFENLARIKMQAKSLLEVNTPVELFHLSCQSYRFDNKQSCESR